MWIRFRRPWLAVVTAALALLAFVPAASAASLSLTTRYPGLTVRPGAQLNLTLEVAHSGAGGIADLAVTEVPEGWETPSLRGGGFAVNQVYVGAGDSETVTLSLKVPDAAAEGRYRVVVTAQSGGETAALPLMLNVAASATGRASLSTDYPAIQAKTGTTYTFRVTLRNEGDLEEVFALGAAPPEGWEVTFKTAYDAKQVGSIPVGAGSSQSIDVSVKVPEQVDAGTYRIPVTARSGSAEAKIDLELEVLGTYALSLSTPSGRLSFDATAGRGNDVTLEVTNTGSVPLRRVNLSASTPLNWSVTFSPETLEDLPPGETRQVTATVKPDGKALAGDYLVTMRASADGSATSDSAEFRVAVRTSTLWGAAGLITLVAVGLGLGWVFKTYGRR